MTARMCASSAATSGARRARWKASPPILFISMSRSRRAPQDLPVENTRHAFAYVFAGSGKFCNASGPLAVHGSVNWLDTAPPSKPIIAR